MTKFDKATDLYLRGFDGKYIKNRTGISVQSLLKQWLSRGVRYTQADVVAYQINYIKQRYSNDDIEAAYHEIMSSFADLDKAKASKSIHVLGCAFGAYPKVFRSILGESAYQKLRDAHWKMKQVQTVNAKYGVDNVFDKSVFASVVSPEALAAGREKRKNTLLEKYGGLSPNSDPEVARQMMETLKATCKDKYGVEYPAQVPEVAQRITQARQETMLRVYGARNSVESEELRNKIFDARRKNGTLNTSVAEDALYKLLILKFGESDVLRNVIVDARYPYHVDFYIKSRDLFIELNGDKCHNDHWFDPENKRDQQILRSWEENLHRLPESERMNSRYQKFIITWTKSDVEKRQTAKQHSLNYLVFWDGRTKMRKKKKEALLSDAKEWFLAGCPDSKDWNKANTF